MRVKFTPSRSAVWQATGAPLIGASDEFTSEAGQRGVATVINPDQAGFIDEAGNAVRNWTIRAVVEYILDGRLIADAAKVFTLTSTDTTMDLDTVIPVTSSAGVTVAIPDTWSIRVIAAEGAALAAAQALANLPAAMSSELDKPASPFTTKLSNTYVTFLNHDGSPVTGKHVVITLTADQADIADITVEAI
ncbi:MAG: hypothetical protein EPO52_17720 [Herbiconiux sp.]|uniref:hypothetical protein n=1 Tax=Herbiconiux sp. TaxID=1871186 RepID=UPI00121691DF|nr:hypothetical protein [Herbiconiux sp.]TAJ46372.1 MAG: hypothetical protein EPO52_17720 [Herbiconiux sp.]